MITPRKPYWILGLKGLITLVLRIISVLKERHPADPFLQGSIAKAEAAEEEASKTVGSTRKSSLTKTVTQADDDRDNTYEALKYTVKGGMKRSSQAAREASERLWEILKQHGLGLADLPYDEETAALLQLFEDLDKPGPQADLTTISAMDIYNELKTHQDQFEEAVQDRGEDRTANSTLTVTEAIKVLKPKLENLFKVLDVAEEEELVAGMGETNDIINALIKEIVDANRRSAGNGEHDDEDPETDPEDETPENEAPETDEGPESEDPEDEEPEEDPIAGV